MPLSESGEDESLALIERLLEGLILKIFLAPYELPEGTSLADHRQRVADALNEIRRELDAQFETAKFKEWQQLQRLEQLGTQVALSAAHDEFCARVNRLQAAVRRALDRREEAYWQEFEEAVNRLINRHRPSANQDDP